MIVTLSTHMFCDFLYGLNHNTEVWRLPTVNNGDFEIHLNNPIKLESEVCDVIEELIKWINTEYEREYYFSDEETGDEARADFALMVDSNPIAYIEVKRKVSGIPSAIGQLLRYKWFHRREGRHGNLSLILIAPSYTDSVIDICRENEIVPVSFLHRRT